MTISRLYNMHSLRTKEIRRTNMDIIFWSGLNKKQKKARQRLAFSREYNLLLQHLRIIFHNLLKIDFKW